MIVTTQQGPYDNNTTSLDQETNPYLSQGSLGLNELIFQYLGIFSLNTYIRSDVCSHQMILQKYSD